MIGYFPPYLSMPDNRTRKKSDFPLFHGCNWPIIFSAEITRVSVDISPIATVSCRKVLANTVTDLCIARLPAASPFPRLHKPVPVPVNTESRWIGMPTYSTKSLHMGTRSIVLMHPIMSSGYQPMACMYVHTPQQPDSTQPCGVTGVKIWMYNISSCSIRLEVREVSSD